MTRGEKITSWLEKKENLILVGILMFALAVRIYFFYVSRGQTVWWDEAEYLSTAKHWAFDVPYELNAQRPPLFQFILALFFMAGLGEVIAKFVTVVIPSFALVFAIYLLGAEMYNKKVGLIAAFFASVSWTFLFWSARFQPDFFSMTFQVLAVWFMWRYWKDDSKNTRLAIFAGVAAAVAFYFKISALLVPLTFAIFMLIKDGASMFKNKNNYLFALAFVLTLVPFFIWSFSTFGDPFAIFHSGYSGEVGSDTPFGWYNLQFIGSLTTNDLKTLEVFKILLDNPIAFFRNSYNLIIFFAFGIGLVLLLGSLLYIDLYFKDKKKLMNANLFSVLAIILTAAFYIFYIKFTEDRWVFLWLPFIFFIAGSALLKLEGKLKKYGPGLAAVVLVCLIFLAGVGQLKHANNLIESRKESYGPVKVAGIWLRDNSNPADEILSLSSPQGTYYAERKVSNMGDIGKDNFDAYLEENRPKYIQVSIFEMNPEWLNQWIGANQDRLVPVQAYFQDPQKTKALLVIYEIKYPEKNLSSSLP